MYKVTVGISCYKQKKWLYRCLRSLASQKMCKKDFEVIVVNDDPDEDIKSVCEKNIFKERLNIRLIQNSKNLGLPGSLNKILQNSMGRYFVRVDSDDYVSKDYLSYLSIFLDKNREYQAVSCNYDTVNHVGNFIKRNVNNTDSQQIACGVMFTYESLCEVGFYNNSYKMREGHDLMKRYEKKFKCFNIPIPLYRYRMHECNRTKNLEEVKQYDKMLKMEKS
jgi:glycosyltransferase involved in cell wall biosynthesis